jgi:hypothetical protein
VFGWASGWTMGGKCFVFFAFCIISDLMAAILDFIFSSKTSNELLFFSLDIGEDI